MTRIVALLIFAANGALSAIAEAQDKKWEEFVVLLRDGYRIVAASDSYVFMQREGGAFYCYSAPEPSMPWQCWDMKKMSPALMKKLQDEINSERR